MVLTAFGFVGGSLFRLALRFPGVGVALGCLVPHAGAQECLGVGGGVDLCLGGVGTLVQGQVRGLRVCVLWRMGRFCVDFTVGT